MAGIDLLNTPAIDANIVDPFLDRLRNEVIPQIQAAVRAELNNAIAQGSNVVQGTLLGVQGVEDKAAADVQKIINGLDGWSVTIGPFTIPEIPIRLKGKP